MEQTAVEWYEKEINSLIEKYESEEISYVDFITMKHNAFYPASEIFEQQIKDAYQTSHISTMTADQYYTEKFK
jgi:hypothetical protein